MKKKKHNPGVILVSESPLLGELFVQDSKVFICHKLIQDVLYFCAQLK